jgi:hypothetical protein
MAAKIPPASIVLEQILFSTALAMVAAAFTQQWGNAEQPGRSQSGYIAVMGLVGFGPDIIRPYALVLNVLVSTIGTVPTCASWWRPTIFFRLAPAGWLVGAWWIDSVGSPAIVWFYQMLTRRQFASGSAAIVSSGLIGGSRYGMGEAAPFTTPLPIPRLIDAAHQGNAVKLKVMSGRHAFIKGKPTRTYGYSAPVLAQSSSCAVAMKWR